MPRYAAQIGSTLTGLRRTHTADLGNVGLDFHAFAEAFAEITNEEGPKVNNTGAENLGDNGLAAEPTYLTDLDRCTPAGALSPDTRRGHWRTLPYETDEFSGVMLMAGTESAAPEVTYPLGRSGWHAVSFGVFGGYYEPDLVLVRFSGDDTFTPLRLQRHATTAWYRQYNGEPVWEMFWRVADLTDQDIVIGQDTWRVSPGEEPTSHRSAEAMLAYIKVVPLSDAEVSEYRANRARTDNRRLFTHNDAGTIGAGTSTPEKLRRAIDIYRDTDFSRIYFEAGSGDSLNYFSKIGISPPHGSLADLTRESERTSWLSWRAFRDQDIDPFGVVLDHAHDIGLEFHGGYRVSGFHYPPPYDHAIQGPSFFKFHQELRGTGRNGQPSPRISYTFPETQRFVLSILREITTTFPVDGISLQFNRRLPVVEYEPSLVAGFKAEYGQDPFELDERDARWLQYRSGVMTRFMRDVRKAMDDVGEETGRANRLGVSAVVTNSRDENLYYGLDMDTWVKEGLVDTLIPYSSNPNFNSNDPSWEDVRDAEYWVLLTKGTSTKLALNIMPRQMRPEEYRGRVAPLYDAGVEHFFFWDGAMGRSQSTGASHVMRRLGHKEEVAAWVKAGGANLDAPQMWLRKLGDWDFSYVSPG